MKWPSRLSVRKADDDTLGEYDYGSKADAALLHGEAVFDSDRIYRYRLSREWLLGAGTCAFVMLNPSTADERKLDPTVRRCVRFAQRWEFRRLEVVNLFALRSTDPSALTKVPDPVGPENLGYIESVARKADRVVVAWGKHGSVLGQGQKVAARLRAIGIETWCFGLNSDGTPTHPLYQPNDSELIRFRPLWMDL